MGTRSSVGKASPGAIKSISLTSHELYSVLTLCICCFSHRKLGPARCVPGMLFYPQFDLRKSPRGAWRWRGLSIGFRGLAGRRGKAEKTPQKMPGEVFGVGLRGPSCQRSPPKQQPPVQAQLGAQRGPFPLAELHPSPTAAPPSTPILPTAHYFCPVHSVAPGQPISAATFIYTRLFKASSCRQRLGTRPGNAESLNQGNDHKIRPLPPAPLPIPPPKGGSFAVGREMGNWGCSEPRGANASPVRHLASPALIYSPWEGARKGFPIPLMGFIVEMPSGNAVRELPDLGEFLISQGTNTSCRRLGSG